MDLVTACLNLAPGDGKRLKTSSAGRYDSVPSGWLPSVPPR